MDCISRRFPLPSLSSLDQLAETIRGSRAAKMRVQRSAAEHIAEIQPSTLAEETAPYYFFLISLYLRRTIQCMHNKRKRNVSSIEVTRRKTVSVSALSRYLMRSVQHAEHRASERKPLISYKKG
jgi:hypothetical protein